LIKLNAVCRSSLRELAQFRVTEIASDAQMLDQPFHSGCVAADLLADVEVHDSAWNSTSGELAWNRARPEAVGALSSALCGANPRRENRQEAGSR
jgi:hypothetical protein